MANACRGRFPRHLRIVALIFAAVGLFGMTYLAVSQRIREFGIRTALGATAARREAGAARRDVADPAGSRTGIGGRGHRGPSSCRADSSASTRRIRQPTPPVPLFRPRSRFSRVSCRPSARQERTRWWRSASTRSYLTNLTLV